MADDLIMRSSTLMKPETYYELQKIRNLIAHGRREPDPSALAKDLAGLGILVEPEDLPGLIPAFLAGFSPSGAGGFPLPPQFFLYAIERLLNGRSAEVVCDPWAESGQLLATIQGVTGAKRAFAFSRH